MNHHLQIIVILDIVTLQNGNPAIHHHVLGVEGAYQRRVEVDDLHIDIGNLLGAGEVDILPRVLLLGDVVMRFEQLFGTATVVDDLDDDPGVSLTGTAVEFADGVGEEFGSHAVLPVVGGQEYLALGADNGVGHVAGDVRDSVYDQSAVDIKTAYACYLHRDDS
jgi:hypothetical protein